MSFTIAEAPDLVYNAMEILDIDDVDEAEMVIKTLNKHLHLLL